MKRGSFCLLFTLIGGFAVGQTILSEAWKTSSVGDPAILEQRISEVIESSRRHNQGDLALLHGLFEKTQSTFLRRYKSYEGMEGLLAGRYDCLTATTLFADILNKAGFHFTIFETNYHIFLVVRTTRGNVLLETTDRFNGFVTNQRKINEKVSSYRQATPMSTLSSRAYVYSADLYGDVTPAQLPGLLYFNQAVKAYNQQDWVACAQKLALAGAIRPSMRVTELATILLTTVSLKDVAGADKERVHGELESLRGYPGIPIASR